MEGGMRGNGGGNAGECRGEMGAGGEWRGGRMQGNAEGKGGLGGNGGVGECGGMQGGKGGWKGMEGWVEIVILSSRFRFLTRLHTPLNYVIILYGEPPAQGSHF